MHTTIQHVKRPLIIVNDAAAKARRAWPSIRQRIEAGGVDFDFFKTAQPGDATTKTRAALRDGVTTIAAVGGDGTLSEAAEGFFEFGRPLTEPPTPINPAASLAILPAGTGDDFARGITGQRAPLTQWIDIFTAHCRHDPGAGTRTVDVLYGLCNALHKPFICLNASSMGIGAETAARVAAQGKLARALPGGLRFALAAMAVLASWRERRVRITVDGDEVLDGPLNLAAVTNARYAGGGMMLAPLAQFDDGKLDVVSASGMNRLHVMRELARIRHGGHLGNPRVRIVQGTRARVETFSPEDALLVEADGNVRGITPVEFRVIPAALRFVV
jgi:YegS/Rv2252/BmrU family lipid kinase